MVLDIDASNEPKKSKKFFLSSASYAGMMLDELMDPLLSVLGISWFLA